ncbi:hypothetical protein HYH03_005022 [Edaphochlamys debaryana]|uniref:FAD/NAD(P)-binding domain-containing protein n=1 Tax=Edaphochlamys debaryana TaxID=47281 RepID=A0A836C2V5_9CHLO|nr:hypothetical protein HYH03_005022 [Edaphochlamys debaryana]|eukprot:KAG2497019.1 hypothetical protein HYH03_005022 [Edaphochlamys debaryana]
MLPGWASGFYGYRDCHIDLASMAAYAGARLITAEATGLDVQSRHILIGNSASSGCDTASGEASTQQRQEQQQPFEESSQERVPYDVLSIDIGITPGSSGVPGAATLATPVKPIDSFVQRYEALLERFRQAAAAAAAAAESAAGKADAGPLLRVAVVGGGAGGVELAAAVRYRLDAERRKGGWRQEAVGDVEVSLVCRGGLLAGHPPHVRRLVRRLLAERRVAVLEGDAVARVEPTELMLAGGARVPYDECLWCTAAAPAAWLRDTGLPTDRDGFISITETMQCEGGPAEVFAAGDVASSARHPRPKAGVYAVRQGPPLAANVMALLQGRPLQPFVPQRTALALISMGDRFCVASRTGGQAGTAAGSHGKGAEGDGPEWPLGWLLNGGGGRAAWSGPLLWAWKDRIDRAFMRKYGEDLMAGNAELQGPSEGLRAAGGSDRTHAD